MRLCSVNRMVMAGQLLRSDFVISGFLITRSYQNTKSIIRFLLNRLLRIFPGFQACLIVTILLFALILHYEKYRTLLNYFQFHQAGPLQYLKSNFLMDLPFPGAFNGSLLTLAYELKCFLGIAFLGWTKILSRQKILVPIFFFFFFQIYIVDSIYPGAVAKISSYFIDIYNYKLPMFSWQERLHICTVRMLLYQKKC